jgi:hypothetical protein
MNDIIANCIFYIFLCAIGMFFIKKKVNKKKKDKELPESLMFYEELKDLSDMPSAEKLKYKYPVIPLVDFEKETKKQDILNIDKKMKIDKELIEKCKKFYANFKIDKKINLFGNFKYKLLDSKNHEDWLENIANLYIIVFSMKDTKNYQEIISQEFENCLKQLVYEKPFICDLWSEIISEIEKILEEKK